MASAVIQDLLQRRTPQYIALYLGASWGVVQFMAFLEDRYLLSPHLTNLVLLLVTLLLPSVALFAYLHGRPGRDRWGRLEKVGIPVNVALTLVVLFVVFSGKELGAVTTTVTVEDEQGNALERAVPKGEFRKRIALFPLDVEDGTAPDAAWVGGGATLALMSDLFQDLFLDLRPLPLFREALREAGFGGATEVPRTLKRRVAQESHIRYFLDGTAARTPAGYRLTLGLHDADRGRVVAEHTLEGADLFSLVDQASLALRRDLELPARHLEETPDLPVTEILTESLDALRGYSEGVLAMWVSDDYATGAASLREAVAVDPGFADAHFALYQTLLLMGDQPGAVASLQQAMDHIYRLPERSQFAVKGEWFAMQQDFPKSFAVYEMWADLYPQDINAQLAVAQLRLYQDDRAGGIEKFEQVLDLDPGRVELLMRIGALREALGETAAAIAAYERYVEAAPADKAGYVALADLRRRAGEHDAARDAYEQALLLEPGDVEVRLSIAGLDRDVGRFEEALAGLERAAAEARTDEQKFAAHRALSAFHRYRGADRLALEHTRTAITHGDAFQPPLARLQVRLLSLDWYVRAGMPDSALSRLEALSAQLAAPPMNALIPLGRISVYEALGRPDDLAAAVRDGREMLERTGLRALEQQVIYGEGRMHELRGEWDRAVAAYERERTFDPTDVTVPMQIGRVLRQAGDLDRAEAELLAALRARPSEPRAHYELALLYEARGRPADAAEHLRRALDAWATADPDHELAGQARSKLAALPVGVVGRDD